MCRRDIWWVVRVRFGKKKAIGSNQIVPTQALLPHMIFTFQIGPLEYFLNFNRIAFPPLAALPISPPKPNQARIAKSFSSVFSWSHFLRSFFFVSVLLFYSSFLAAWARWIDGRGAGWGGCMSMVFFFRIILLHFTVFTFTNIPCTHLILLVSLPISLWPRCVFLQTKLRFHNIFNKFISD